MCRSDLANVLVMYMCFCFCAARLMETMKRVTRTVLSNGGVFRKVENLGSRELGYSISRQDTTGKYDYEK